MRKLFVYLLICVVSSLVVSVSPAYADDDHDDPECAEDPRKCFEGSDKDGNIIPKSPEPARTFNFPYMKAGFIIDLNNKDILPHLSIELFNFSIPKAGDFAVDAGVGVSRAFLSLSWEFIPLIKAGPTIWGGYNIVAKEAAFGVGVSILDF